MLVYSNNDDDTTIFKTWRYYLSKDIIDDYNIIINRKNWSYDQPIHYEEIRKLTTGLVKNYTTGCLLDYEYIKNHYRLMNPCLLKLF